MTNMTIGFSSTQSSAVKEEVRLREEVEYPSSSWHDPAAIKQQCFHCLTQGRTNVGTGRSKDEPFPGFMLESFSSDDALSSSEQSDTVDQSCCTCGGAAGDGESPRMEELEFAAGMELNHAYVALEEMRKLNLEITFASLAKTRNIHDCCTACLHEELYHQQQQHARTSSRWGRWFNKKAPPPCLVCANPVCSRHSCREVYLERDGLHVCLECAPLFRTDSMVQALQQASATSRSTAQEFVTKMIDAYDRASILLQYAGPYLEEIASSLETNSKSTNQIQVSSSGVGIMSGVTGVGAVAGHAAAGIHFTAAAALLTPAGPPLLLASLVLGGTAASASIGTELYNSALRRSQRGQFCSKVVSWYHVVTCISSVVCGGTGNPLLENLSQHHDDDNLQIEDPAEGDVAKAGDNHRSSEAGVLSSMDDNNDNVVTGGSLSVRAHGDSSDSPNVNKKESEVFLTPTEKSQSTAVVVKKSNNNSSNGRHPLACLMPLTPLADDALVTASKLFMDPTGGARVAVSRASSHAFKVAQIATIACGALSAATIVMEANNLSKSLDHLKKGSPCQRAQMLRKIQSELKILPGTEVVAAQCALYLEQADMAWRQEVGTNLQTDADQ